MQPRPIVTRFFLGAMLITLTDCAVVTKGFHQKIEITSVPAGATVVVDGAERGKTPLTVSLTRANGHDVEVRKPGFATVRQGLTPTMTDYSKRVIRFGVDIDSGAASELSPSAINVELVPEILNTMTSGDAFEQMGAAVTATDDLWRRGVVSESDHRYMIEKILARFAH